VQLCIGQAHALLVPYKSSNDRNCCAYKHRELFPSLRLLTLNHPITMKLLQIMLTGLLASVASAHAQPEVQPIVGKPTGSLNVRPWTTSTKPATPSNTYQSCGGFRVQPVSCPRGYQCINDARNPGCGMACDMPGIWYVLLRIKARCLIP
jgi:hypothetical protein